MLSNRLEQLRRSSKRYIHKKLYLQLILVGTMLVLYILFLATIHFISAVSGTYCGTPDGELGHCIPITECQPLHDFYNNNKPLTRKNADFLRSRHCGFSGRIPKVCCAKSNLLDRSTCGYMTVPKIYGGEKTRLDEFPWLALLQYKNATGTYFGCGGALINKRYVLTAAHCIHKRLISVRLGEYDIATDTDCITTLDTDCAPPHLNIPVEEKIVHETYETVGINRYNDIALIRLKEEVAFSDYVRPICLPTSSGDIQNYSRKFDVAGWGMTEKHKRSNVKLKVKVPLRNNSYCEEQYQRFGLPLALNYRQLCAGGGKGMDPCKGDSGGPLMTPRIDKNGDHQWYAVGVVSFGLKQCAMKGWGGVYTKVDQYLPWIIRNLKP